MHDLSDGGLDLRRGRDGAGVRNVGVALSATSEQNAAPYLFGEDQARYLVATSDPDVVLAAAKSAGVHAMVCGEAYGDVFASRELFSIPLKELRAANEGWLPAYMG